MTAKEFVISKYPEAFCKYKVFFTLPPKYNYVIYTSKEEENQIANIVCMEKDRFEGEQKSWEDAEKFIMSTEK